MNRSSIRKLLLLTPVWLATPLAGQAQAFAGRYELVEDSGTPVPYEIDAAGVAHLFSCTSRITEVRMKGAIQTLLPNGTWRTTTPLAGLCTGRDGRQSWVEAGAPAAARSGTGSTTQSQTFRPGQRVEARWRSTPTSEPWNRWDPATLLEVGNGRHLIRWDSNITPQWVEAALIRPMAGATQAPAMKVGDRVQATIVAGGTAFVPATVVEVGQGQEAGLYRVRFERDGRVEWRNPHGEIQTLAPGRPSPNTPSGPTAAALPRTLPTGEYQCFYGMATGFDPEAMSSYMGSFQVTSSSSYRFLTGTKLTGQYQYDSTNGRITWRSGSLDGKLFRGQFRPARGNERASITLQYRDRQGREATQHCRKIR